MKFKARAALIFLVLAVYVPFLGVRMIRPSGDEKVYLAQALEMQAQGHWFLQSLAGQPDYYKGPLHYLLLRLGFLVFGQSLWAGLYMNLAFCLLGALAVSAIVRGTYPAKPHWPLAAGAIFAFGTGLFGHLFASQMEVELAGIFAMSYFFLWRDRGVRDELMFWSLAGFAGWLKSPLHSLLLGTGAVLFWILNGELRSRIRMRSIGCALFGIAICSAGYAPAFFYDHDNFIRLYIQRETLKAGNGGAWWQSLLAILSYYLIPWMSLTLVALSAVFTRHFWRRALGGTDPAERRTFRLALATFLPTAVFFASFPYRNEIYDIPVIASVVLLVLFALNQGGPRSLRVRNRILGTTCVIFFALPIAFQALAFRFGPLPWWPEWFMPTLWTFSTLGIGLQLWEHFLLRTDGLGPRATLGNVCMMVAIGLVMANLGEMEVFQLKTRLSQDRAGGSREQVSYWNLNHLIWNEWGLMSLAVHEKIQPLLSDADLVAAIQRGDLILARDTGVARDIDALAKKDFPELVSQVYPWHRWKTHAADGAGNSLIPKAWADRDLTLLEDRALMIQYRKP